MRVFVSNTQHGRFVIAQQVVGFLLGKSGCFRTGADFVTELLKFRDIEPGQPSLFPHGQFLIGYIRSTRVLRPRLRTRHIHVPLLRIGAYPSRLMAALSFLAMGLAITRHDALP